MANRNIAYSFQDSEEFTGRQWYRDIDDDKRTFVDSTTGFGFRFTNDTALEKYNAYTRLMIDSEAAKPFNMLTFPPVEGDEEIASAIIELSRLKYGKDRVQVSEEILRRSKLGATDTEDVDFPDLEPSL